MRPIDLKISHMISDVEVSLSISSVDRKISTHLKLTSGRRLPQATLKFCDESSLFTSARFHFERCHFE